MTKTTPDETVFERARQVHGNRFDYSNSAIESRPCGKSRKRYIINTICNDCGYIFDVTINNHIDKKSSCRSCLSKLEWSLEAFIQKSESFYPGAFNLQDCYLSKLEDGNKIIANKILCNKCKYVFSMIPKDFFRSTCGCPSCAGRAVYTVQLVTLRGQGTQNSFQL